MLQGRFFFRAKLSISQGWNCVQLICPALSTNIARKYGEIELRTHDPDKETPSNFQVGEHFVSLYVGGGAEEKRHSSETPM